MKRLTLFIIVFCLTTILFGQQLKIGTIEGTAFVGPLVTKVLKDAGLNATITQFKTQPELIAALAKREIDGAFFLAQPLIAQANGAIMIPVRLHQSNFYALSIDPSITINSLGDLKKYTVGIVKGNMAHSALTRGAKTVTVNSEMEQYSALAAKKYQVAITVDKIVPSLCAVARIKKYYLSKQALLQVPTFFALSAAQAGNKSKIEIAFKNWQDSGKWNSEIKKLEAAR